MHRPEGRSSLRKPGCGKMRGLPGVRSEANTIQRLGHRYQTEAGGRADPVGGGEPCPPEALQESRTVMTES